MTATAAQIAQVRRMVNEVSFDVYSNDDIQAYIEMYPLLDAFGNAPYMETEYIETTPDTLTENTEWIATYDLNAAAADIWAEKAGTIAANYDFTTQGQGFSRNQAYQSYMAQSRYYRSRRATKTIRQQLTPKPPDWIAGDLDPDQLDDDTSN